jgi:dimeric dUTPase (all-alpha-NTP-PPase superfamily)
MDNESKNIKIAELASENMILKYGSKNALQELSNAYEEYIFNLLLVSGVYENLPSRDRINQFKTKHDIK